MTVYIPERGDPPVPVNPYILTFPLMYIPERGDPPVPVNPYILTPLKIHVQMRRSINAPTQCTS